VEHAFRLTLEYDGAAFVGWEVQREGRSVQGEVEGALARILQHPVRVQVSGRTDSGVHAVGQVAVFRTIKDVDPTSLLRGLNAVLPLDIACHQVLPVSPTFDPRRHAKRKHYRYRWLDGGVRSPLRRGRVYEVRPCLDVESMHLAAQQLVGTHDFAAFRASGCGAATTVRTIGSWDVQRVGDEVWLDTVGHGYLRHMVRIVAGALTEIGRGARDAPWLAAGLNAKERTALGPTAPAHALTLMSVHYDN
jgi:tRNA pseudouridine38-40 synthase